jgi:hypothetical protein
LAIILKEDPIMKSLMTAMAISAALMTPCAAETIYGLTNLQQLVSFDSSTRAVTSTTSLTGFSLLGEILLSIDVRPATGQLYGYSNQNNLYIIDPLTGGRTQVGSTLSTVPQGAYKAIDFNPTVDRIRLLGSGGAPNNLRLNPDTGALVMVDGTLSFGLGDPNQGDTPAVVNGAYTNSRPGVTSTTLYDLEAGNDVLVTQTPANNGTLQTIGSIGFNLTTSGGFTGFDISGASGAAYLVGNLLGSGGLTANALYQVNLGTGAATLLGPVTGVNGSFRDIAVANVVPEPGTLTLVLISSLLIFRRQR